MLAPLTGQNGLSACSGKFPPLNLIYLGRKLGKLRVVDGEKVGPPFSRLGAAEADSGG